MIFRRESVFRLTGLALLLSLTPLTGCAWLIGHGELPPPGDDLPWAGARREVRRPGLLLEITCLGVGERLVAARNVWGRIGRVVNPYGLDTFVFQVMAHNLGTEPIVLLAEQAELRLDGGVTRRSRTLGDFRLRWPTWAITNPDEKADRDAAFAHVLETLLLDREMAPGQITSGRLAFAAVGRVQEGKLTLPFRQGSSVVRPTVEWRSP